MAALTAVLAMRDLDRVAIEATAAGLDVAALADVRLQALSNYDRVFDLVLSRALQEALQRDEVKRKQ